MGESGAGSIMSVLAKMISEFVLPIVGVAVFLIGVRVATSLGWLKKKDLNLPQFKNKEEERRAGLIFVGGICLVLVLGYLSDKILKSGVLEDFRILLAIGETILALVVTALGLMVFKGRLGKLVNSIFAFMWLGLVWGAFVSSDPHYTAMATSTILLTLAQIPISYSLSFLKKGDRDIS